MKSSENSEYVRKIEEENSKLEVELSKLKEELNKVKNTLLKKNKDLEDVTFNNNSFNINCNQ